MYCEFKRVKLGVHEDMFIATLFVLLYAIVLPVICVVLVAIGPVGECCGGGGVDGGGNVKKVQSAKDKSIKSMHL